MKTIEQLREERAALVTQVTAIRDAADAEGRDLTEDEEKNCNDILDQVEARDEKIKAEERAQKHLRPVLEQRKAVPATEPEARHARPKDPDSEEKTYRPDRHDRSFWRDLILRREGNMDARDRLQYNQRQAIERNENVYGYGYAESRDMNVSSTSGGDFLPPLYLADLWIHPTMAGRPFADALPKYPLPPTGLTITIPKLSSGISVAARAGTNASVSETDGVTATVTHYVNEYAGLSDIDRLEVMRSDPGFDTVVTRTLVRRYNVALDVDLISGSGTQPRHKGLDNLSSGLNTETWTQATPTGSGFIGQVYKGVADIDTNRLEERADLIVMHGRRQAWLAQTFSSTFPIIQVGDLFQAAGTQDAGFTQTIGGLRIITDNNVTTTAGAGTNQDKAYLVCSQDLLLAEGPLYARVHEGVGSGTGTIRYAVFAHSAFISDRYPTGVAIITGTGMVAPSFNS